MGGSIAWDPMSKPEQDPLRTSSEGGKAPFESDLVRSGPFRITLQDDGVKKVENEQGDKVDLSGKPRTSKLLYVLLENATILLSYEVLSKKVFEDRITRPLNWRQNETNKHHGAIKDLRHLLQEISENDPIETVKGERVQVAISSSYGS